MVNLIFFIPLLIIIAQAIRLYYLFKRDDIVEKGLLKRRKELSYLSFLTTSINLNSESLEEAVPKILNRLRDDFKWKYTSLFRLDEKTQTIPVRFTGYLPKWYMEELSTKVLVKVGDAAAGRAVSTKQPAIINATEQDPRFENVQSYSTRAGYRSLSCYPLMGTLKTHGSYCVYSEHNNIFTVHDIQFLSTCGNFFGIYLENKLLSSLDTKT